MYMYLDVVGNNGDIFEVKCCINFIHHVQWRWLVVMQGKHLKEVNMIFKRSEVLINSETREHEVSCYIYSISRCNAEKCQMCRK